MLTVKLQRNVLCFVRELCYFVLLFVSASIFFFHSFCVLVWVLLCVALRCGYSGIFISLLWNVKKHFKALSCCCCGWDIGNERINIKMKENKVRKTALEFCCFMNYLKSRRVFALSWNKLLYFTCLLSRFILLFSSAELPCMFCIEVMRF